MAKQMLLEVQWWSPWLRMQSDQRTLAARVARLNRTKPSKPLSLPIATLRKLAILRLQTPIARQAID